MLLNAYAYGWEIDFQGTTYINGTHYIDAMEDGLDGPTIHVRGHWFWDELGAANRAGKLWSTLQTLKAKNTIHPPSTDDDALQLGDFPRMNGAPDAHGPLMMGSMLGTAIIYRAIQEALLEAATAGFGVFGSADDAISFAANHSDDVLRAKNAGRIVKEETKVLENGTIVLKLTDGTKLTVDSTAKAVGQLHHVIATKVARAIDDHPILKGAFARRDPRFVTRAIDGAAHRGYQRWHRELDAEVVTWIERNREKTAEDFLAFLKGLYERPDIKARFPNGF